MNLESVQQLYIRALALHEQGELEQACDLYHKVLDQVPDGDSVLYNYALALHGLGDFAGAADALSRAVEINEEDADYWFNLALSLKGCERFVEAVGAYKRALAIRPDDVEILYSLGCCCKDCDAVDQAVAVYEHVLELDPGFLPALNNLAYMHHLQGNLEAAGVLYHRILELEPEHPGASMMVKAVQGVAAAAPPKEYVRELFDGFAANFDNHLMDKLEYRVPGALRMLLDKGPRRKSYNHCLDLGCGTGLCGELFRDCCGKLTGIDLSGEMVRRAGDKQVYDELVEAELIAYLGASEKPFDLFLAADVFTYLGDLEPVFEAIAAKGSESAHLLFSVEAGGDDASWVLQSSGRYAHGRQYVEQTAASCGFTLCLSEEAHLRKERGQWVDGVLYFFSL